MKTITLVLLLLLTGLGLRAQMPPIPPLPTGSPAQTSPTLPGQPGALPIPRRMPFRRPGAINPAAGQFPLGRNPAIPGGFPGGQPGANPAAVQGTPGTSYSNLDYSQSVGDESPTNSVDFQGVDVSQVLEVYAALVNRTLLHGALPQASIVLKTEAPLTRTELIEALQAVLAMNGIQVVNFGDKFVKVVATGDVGTIGAPFDDSDVTNIPVLGPYVTHIVQLQYLKPSVIVPFLTPFSKAPNAATAIDDNGLIVLRDNAENVKRMLEMIKRLDISVPEVYISEVIPIKYAQASDIANALNSLGGQGGGSTVSIGSSPTGGTVSGLRSSGGGFGSSGGGIGSSGGYGSSGGGLNGISGGAGGSSASRFGSTTAGATTANGTPSSGGTFQNRLNAIINSAAATGGGGPGGKQDPIQVFGQTKIIADSRSNSLLVFATREDMVHIKDVISKLDVLLSQVLIEAVIMDVTLGSSFNFGTSVSQGPQRYGSTGGTNGMGAILGGGGINNGQTLVNLASGSFGTASNATSILGNSVSGGLGYFGNIGPNWDVAVSALSSDNRNTVIQRPRIQTSQAKPATFFVGNTVPYVTGTYYGGGYSGGNSSQYSQLSVGVELDVTPFINPDGLVVMDINQEIDDISGTTEIDGNAVPETDKRTLYSEIAVRDQDTIMLGGFIRSQKTGSRSGVPVLEDIPVLGALFSSRSDTKAREELIVLMRPTVLKSLDASAAMTLREERRLPGVSAAAMDDAAYERQLTGAERKVEAKREKVNGQADGFYNMDDTILQTDRIGVATNGPSPHLDLPTTQDNDTPAQAAAKADILKRWQESQEQQQPDAPAPVPNP
jgi:general secretion pathway protein D